MEYEYKALVLGYRDVKNWNVRKMKILNDLIVYYKDKDVKKWQNCKSVLEFVCK